MVDTKRIGELRGAAPIRTAASIHDTALVLTALLWQCRVPRSHWVRWARGSATTAK
jgi:hypothetical protein